MAHFARAASGAVLAAALIAGCDDGQSGIPTETPKTPVQEHTDNATPPSITDAPPTTTSSPVSITVGEVPGNPAAAQALQAWADDVSKGDIAALTDKCWTVAPELVATMYADVDTIAAVVQNPGIDGQYAASWTDGTTRISAKRGEISSGYACPHVYQEGATSYYTLTDAEHATTRYLSRVAGEPVNEADTESEYPLVCPGNSPWDPRSTGAGGEPPLKRDPLTQGDIDSLDPASVQSRSLNDSYAAVTAQVETNRSTEEWTAILAIGPDGYCLGEIDTGN
ncbi:MAG: hypothetical protein GX542_11540 [Rhodococcus sp.]|nr:hypothetical protein [Rhodococcus sp. (in: high G+C Gram-positive bacteria)]